MPIFRCDFQVSGDLALPPEEAKLETTISSGHMIVMRNDAPDTSGNIPGLVCSVIGHADELDGTDKLFREILAGYLDVMCFATQSRFVIEKTRRLMDWEPGPSERRMKIFETFEGSYPPERTLVADYLQTVSELEAAGVPDFARTALKYFRYGFLERTPEDQFMRFWLALEVVAENLKPRDKEPIPCADCGGAMKCPTCGAQPHRRPMASEAIREIIRQVTGEMASSVSKRQFAARNGIMHGRGLASIEADCKMPIDRVLNELAAVTWQALASAIPLPETGPPLVFGYRDEYTSKSLTVAMIGGFPYNGATPHPPEDFLPSADISLVPPKA